jgi:hypothetical protein
VASSSGICAGAVDEERFRLAPEVAAEHEETHQQQVATTPNPIA